MNIGNIILIQYLPLDIDCINKIHQCIVDSFDIVNISKLLEKSVILKQLDFDKVFKYNEKMTLYHCGRFYNVEQSNNILNNSTNIIVFKHAFNLYPATLTITYAHHGNQIKTYNQVMTYIKNNPHKLYIFGNKKSDLIHIELSKLPNVYYID